MITSKYNARVKRLVALRDRKDRDEESVYLIEGYRELRRAVDAKTPITELYIAPELFLGTNEDSLIADARRLGAEVTLMDKTVFEKVAYRDRPDGMIAVARQEKPSLQELENHLNSLENPFIIVCEAIEKPGNLGSMLRSADAAGADMLILCDPCTDIYNPNVVRASVGTLFAMPIYSCESPDVIALLKKRHIAIVSTTPDTSDIYTEVDLTQPVAIIMGTEQLGLSQQWLCAADIRVRIPMCGIADSLNVASAATLMLYEVLRQRSACGGH